MAAVGLRPTNVHLRVLVRKYGFKSSDGELQDAAQRGDVGEVKRLIESGVPVNSVNSCLEVSSDCTCNIQGRVTPGTPL